MPLGDAVGSILAYAFGEVLFKWFISPVLRFPGAVIGWMIWCGRPFSMVWHKGDGFKQGMVGLLFYALISVAFAAF